MIDLRCGDCREFIDALPSRCAIITDTPYGIGFVPKQRHKLTARREAFKPIVGDERPFDPAHLLRFENIVLWGANNFADKLPARGGWLVWDKKDGTTADDSSDCELAWTNRDCAVRLYRYLWRGIVKAVQTRDDEQARLHPYQKPVALFKWCIAQMDVPKDMPIIDPYMGSGSCGVAAVELGYDFMGYEIDEDYFETAQKRIYKYSKQSCF